MIRSLSHILPALLLVLSSYAGYGQTNVLLNGSFESGTTSWAFYTDGAGTFSSVTPGFDGSRAGRVSITTAGTNVQLYQLNVPLDPNTPYRLRFSGYSNTGRDLSVSLLKNVSPYTNYGLNGVVANLTTGWQTFTMEFTTTGFSTPVTDARFRFWFAPYDVAGDAYFIDNVVLEKAGGAPVIAGQPVAQSVYEGQTATFGVGATGTAPLGYQWQKNLVDIPGATGSTYTTPPTALADNGASYRCVVSNLYGTVTSAAAVLTVLSASDPPAITQQPVGRSIYTGQTATFTVVAAGPPPLAFQWEKNGAGIAGAVSASYTTPPAVRADSGSVFRCIVSNSNGSVTSTGALLRVDTLIGNPPVISQHPMDVTVNAGQTATFSVVAGGTLPLSYQWQKNGVNISGATAAGYTTPVTTTADNGAQYRCVVTNIFGNATSNAAVLTVLTPPPPASLLSPLAGELYREYSRVMTGDRDWRVTDPNALNVGAQAYKPNPILNLTVADTVMAVRAEMVIMLFGGHVGTTQKRFRLNGNAWLTIPELGTGNGIPSGASGQCYMQQMNPVIAVPLSHLRQGTNTLEGTTGPQSCYSFNWGMYGWYGVILRVYYRPEKGGPRGTIAQPASGGIITENPVLGANVQGGTLVNRVEFFASYQGFDPDGDGVWGGYQHSYHRLPGETQMSTKFHAGTATVAPFQVTWNTSLVPDQNPGTIAVQARIQDVNGLWYVTPAVTGLTLQRDSISVKQYRIQSVPDRWTVRDGRTTSTTNFLIPAADSLRWALSASFVMRTWNGNNSGADPGETYYYRVNSYTVPTGQIGQSNFYALDIVPLPLSALVSGTNTFTAYSNTIHHGIDILYPGPAFIVRYSKFPPQPPTIVQHPQPQTVADGETALFTVQASGIEPISYQWQRNGVNITGANTAAYRTSPLMYAESGTVYRCVVTNAAGSVTSTGAAVTVTPTALTILQNPASQPVLKGRSAVLSVIVKGTLPVAYQWRRNGVDIPGATGAWYTTPATTTADNGAAYSCVLTNLLGSVTSDTAILTVTSSTPPSILTSDDFNTSALNGSRWVFTNPVPPSDFSLTGMGTQDAWAQVQLAAGEAHDMVPGALTGPRLMQPANNTNFEVEVKFESILNAQYQRQGIIVEQDDRNFMLFDFERRSTSYRVRAVKVVNNVATTQYNSTITGGSILYMKISRSGNTWSHRTSLNGTSWQLPGYFSHTLSVGRVGVWFGNTGSPAPAFTGRLDYFFNTAARISPEDGAAFPPIITGQPQPQTVAVGLEATFTVATTGTPPLIYQWKRGGADIPGATGASYTLSGVTFADSGAVFSCGVTNALGSVTSNGAALRVIPDPSGIAGDDFNAFVLNGGLWTVVDPVGDVSRSLIGTNTPDALLRVDIPAGTAHDIWGAGNQSWRIIQNSANTDFWLEAKYQSALTAQFQFQGILVQQDNLNFIRMDILRRSTGTFLFAASFVNGTPTTRLDIAIPGGPHHWLRVRRAGNTWTPTVSTDGVAWTSTGAFAHNLTVNQVGPYFGTGGSPAPAFTGLLDYFALANMPLLQEDQGTVIDSFPPVITNIQPRVGATSFTVSWTTHEPATSALDYGPTAACELGTVSDNEYGTEHELTVSGLVPGTTYYYRVRSADPLGNASAVEGMNLTTFVPTPPVVTAWYGPVQHFGNIGNPTPYVNVLGNVADANGILSLSYTLNGGPPTPLKIGPDTRRLNRAGDFNIDIVRSTLVAGANIVVITAVDSQFTESRDTVTVNYTPGMRWPRNYTIDWGQYTNIQDVVEVVDGKWAFNGSTVRTVETGYDRLLAIGDLDWTDYEATVRVVVHAVDSSGFLPPSNEPAIGLIMRWPGHSDSPPSTAGFQPKSGFLPLGGFGSHNWTPTGPQRIVILGDQLRVVAEDNSDRSIVLGQAYWMKMKVQGVAGLGTDYFFKIWQDGTTEPAAWDILGREPLSGPQAGSLLLVAHELDVSYGPVYVTAVQNPTTLVSDDFNAAALNSALWRFVNPRNDASATIQGAGTGDVRLAISMPGGVSHEPLLPFIRAPRVLQAVNNASFTAKARFVSPFTGEVQMHGIIVEQDSANFVRFDFSSSGANTKVFAGTARNGSFQARYNVDITTGAPQFMRVQRLGDQWNLYYSYNDTAWFPAATFTHSIDMRGIGPFGGNAGTTPPAYTMVTDFFFNEEAPIVPEDGSPGGVAARVLVDPAARTVAEPDSARFSVLASGTPPLIYRWQRNGVDVPGGTASSLLVFPTSYAGDNGAQYRCIVSNGAGADTSASAALTVAKPPSIVISDDFRGPVLNTSVWRLLNPLNDASATVTGTGTTNARLAISVPAGVVHDVWTGGITAPRVMQDANNTDFGLEAKFESAISTPFQIQGIIIQQDQANLLRFDFVTHSSSNVTRVFAASFVNGTPTTRFNINAYTLNVQPLYLRVERSGDSWTLRYSRDGGTWTTAGSFTHALVVDSVGVFAGNAGTSPPAFTALVDYFYNLAAPLPEEDPVPPVIVTQPSPASATAGRRAVFTVVASGSPPLTYQWQKNGVDLPGATGSTYFTQPLSLDDNGTLIRCIISNPSGGTVSQSALLTVTPAQVLPWWSTRWSFRLPVMVHAGSYDRINKPAEVPVNFSTALATLGHTGRALDTLSIRVIEVDSTHAVLDTVVKAQFDRNPGFHPATNAAGTLVLLMTGATPAGTTRYFDVYFDTTGRGPFTPFSFAPQVAVSDTPAYQGQEAFKIVTTGGTYYYHKRGAGFAGAFDVTGNDWISYRPTGGAAGEYRGIPNTGESFHPGYTNSTSSLVFNGPLRTRIRSVTNDNLWECQWDIFPGYARMVMLRNRATYWWLYEGTPGGSSEIARDYHVRPNGVRRDWTSRVQGDVGTQEWTYMGDNLTNRIIFMAHHEDDTAPEIWKHDDSLMSVFGFGRQDPCCLRYLDTAPQTFTFGFGEDSSFAGASRTIYSAYKDLAVSLDEPQSQGTTGIPVLSTIVSDNFNAPSLSTGLWTYTNPRGDANLSMTGTQLRIDVPGGVGHDLWASGFNAPRIMQPANNANFEVETKFTSVLGFAFQIQGIMVQEDANTALRFDFVRRSAGIYAFAGRVDDGVTITYLNSLIPTANPLYLRVKRVGNSWTHSYSADAATWTVAATFTDNLTVSQVGLFFGNAGTPAPAFVGLADYFINTGAPVLPTKAIPGDSANAPTEVPTTYALSQNYPNPFNPTTTIRYALPEPAAVSLRIYNMLGQEIATLVDAQQEAGYHSVPWRGTNHEGAAVASGVYLYRLTARGSSGTPFTQIRKMTLMR